MFVIDMSISVFYYYVFVYHKRFNFLLLIDISACLCNNITNILKVYSIARKIVCSHFYTANLYKIKASQTTVWYPATANIFTRQFSLIDLFFLYQPWAGQLNLMGHGTKFMSWQDTS